jgi:hypothetical protein
MRFHYVYWVRGKWRRHQQYTLLDYLLALAALACVTSTTWGMLLIGCILADTHQYTCAICEALDTLAKVKK